MCILEKPHSRWYIRIGEGVTLRTRADIVVIGVGMTPAKALRISYVVKLAYVDSAQTSPGTKLEVQYTGKR